MGFVDAGDVSVHPEDVPVAAVAEPFLPLDRRGAVPLADAILEKVVGNPSPYKTGPNHHSMVEVGELKSLGSPSSRGRMAK